MASLVAGFGTSHSTMLLSPLENWLSLFDHIDKKAPIADFDGTTRSFEYLLQHPPGNAPALLSKEAITSRYEKTEQAMSRLREDVSNARLDVLIIVGDDQREIFKDSSRPAIGIYYGDTIRNAAAPSPLPDDWYARDQCKRLEDGKDRHYPCHAGLGTHLIEGLTRRNFDITAIKTLVGEQFEGHAYSFIHHKYMAKATPIPVVPIFLNTYYPPNVPSPRRCLDLGNALRELVQSYPEEIRIGVMASGGLSHFMVNEALDGRVVKAIRQKDFDYLTSLSVTVLQSGTSEIRNWICVAAATSDLRLQWLDYIPAYRSRALTGVGLGFGTWSQPAN